MSSPNSPYKSRLFNWLNRQYMRLSDGLGTNLRNFQVAAKWGVQLLLYPIYFLVQTGRMAGRQLGKGGKAPRKLTPGKSQTIQPIEKVLQDVKPLVIEVVNCNYEANNPALSYALTSSDIIPINHNPKLIIRGIATLLSTKEIVIVTKENNILAIFTDEQQEKIKAIVNQVLNFQEKELVVSKTSVNLPKIKYNHPNVIPAIRQFWQLMGWLQDSNIARKLNLFGEAYLTLNAYTDNSLIVPQSASLASSSLGGYVTDIHALIAAAIAYFFGQDKNTFNKNKNHKSIKEENQQIKLLAKPANTKIENNFNLLKQKIQKSLPAAKATINKVKNEPDPFQIKAIIQAAIDYFLYDSINNVVSSYDSQKLNNSSKAEEWLSLEDIFLENQGNKTALPQPVNSQQKRENILINSGINKTEKKNNKPKKNKNTKKTPKNNNREKTNISITATATNLRESVLQPTVVIEEQVNLMLTNTREENEILETEVTSLGYEKHFLERLLGWLDQILLWFEDFLLKIWRWLKSFTNN